MRARALKQELCQPHRKLPLVARRVSRVSASPTFWEVLASQPPESPWGPCPQLPPSPQLPGSSTPGKTWVPNQGAAQSRSGEGTEGAGEECPWPPPGPGGFGPSRLLAGCLPCSHLAQHHPGTLWLLSPEP